MSLRVKVTKPKIAELEAGLPAFSDGLVVMGA
jgi:hypothetical protein